MLKFMLIPVPTKITFRPWVELKAKYPKVTQYLGLGLADDAAMQQRYTDLQTNKPASLACFMNLITAMDGIGIGGGKTPLDYLKDINWDNTFAQDRFFGYIDPAMIPAVVATAADGGFAEEKNPAALHEGAALSYKQIEYPYSNVQLTFHQNAADSKVIDGLQCVLFMPDMDLYKDLLDHGVLEVLPNLLTHGLTDLIDILSLRGLDTTDAHESPFTGVPITNPPWTTQTELAECFGLYASIEWSSGKSPNASRLSVSNPCFDDYLGSSSLWAVRSQARVSSLPFERAGLAICIPGHNASWARGGRTRPVHCR